MTIRCDAQRVQRKKLRRVGGINRHQLALNPKAEIDLTKANEACASEAGLNVGESPTRRVGLFATEQELNSVAARRG